MKKKLISLLTLTFLLTNVSSVSFAKEETSNNENDKPKYESRSVGTNISLINDGGSSVNPWIVLFEAPPYTVYRNEITKEIKSVITTAPSTHLVDVISSGWARAAGGAYGYRPREYTKPFRP